MKVEIEIEPDFFENLSMYQADKEQRAAADKAPSNQINTAIAMPLGPRPIVQSIQQSKPKSTQSDALREKLIDLSRNKIQKDVISQQMIKPLDEAIRNHLVVNSANESVENRSFKISPYSHCVDEHADLTMCLSKNSVIDCMP